MYVYLKKKKISKMITKIQKYEMKYCSADFNSWDYCFFMMRILKKRETIQWWVNQQKYLRFR